MATTAVNPVLVDTNVLVYANVASAPNHQIARTRLLELAEAGADRWISRQVIREYLATHSRPQTFTSPIPPAALNADVRQFEAQFRIAEEGPDVTARLLTLLETIPIGGKHVHDANVVATMAAQGLRKLLTHNVADFQRFATWADIIPLFPTT